MVHLMNKGNANAMTNAADLTFGIEIETLMPRAAIQSNNWTVNGYHSGYPVFIPGHDGWKATTDSSLHTRNWQQTGVEVVSPVLKGAEGIASVKAMCETLKAMGARVNQSCGFHVHVGWNGTTAQLRRLVVLVAQHEKALHAATGTHSREHNRYCNSIRTNYRRAESTDLRETESLITQSRYHVLNLTNLRNEPARRTVEFRVFAGTTNVAKIMAYVGIALALVQKALNTNDDAAWDAAPSVKANTTGAGQWAMRRLFAQINWFATVSTKRTAMGVMNQNDVPKMVKELKRLAKKYDGPVTAPQAVA
jgi:hypothetical protein